jgi:hypothetical protein
VIPHYRHTQFGWVTIGSIAAGLVFVIPLVAVPGAPGGVALLAAILVLAGLAFSTLTVEVDASEIRVRFTGGLLRKRVALDELRDRRVVRNPWFYGWGIHKIPGGWIWNVSGLDAVELLLADGRVLRIGTDEPEALSRAIAAVAPTATAHGAHGAHGMGRHAERRRPWLALVAAAAVVAGVGAVVGIVRLQMRPPEVNVTSQTLSVHTLFYGQDYPLSEITSVSVERCLPRILMRTNGFAGGGTLRGWFRLEGWGEGKLFVEQGYSPFLVVRLRSGFVVLNFADPEKTRAMAIEIERLRQPAEDSGPKTLS